MPRILLLQSDDQLATTCAAYLRHEGLEVVTHKDPQAAVSAVDSNPPDVIIVDLALAARGAAEFLYELRSYPDWQAIPLIVMGSSPLSQMQRFIDSFNQLGVSRYLVSQTTGLARLAREVEKLAQPAAA